jgi:hypothetical protein
MHGILLQLVHVRLHVLCGLKGKKPVHMRLGLAQGFTMRAGRGLDARPKNTDLRCFQVSNSKVAYRLVPEPEEGGIRRAALSAAAIEILARAIKRRD